MPTRAQLNRRWAAMFGSDEKMFYGDEHLSIDEARERRHREQAVMDSNKEQGEVIGYVRLGEDGDLHIVPLDKEEPPPAR